MSAAGFDPDLFFAVNSVAHGLLLVMTLSAVFLNVICVLALALAKDLIFQIKVVLFNVFLIDVISSVVLSVVFLSYPIGAYSSRSPALDFLCSIIASFALSTFQATIMILAYSTIVIYVYLKCGAGKLKCCVTVVYLAITWISSIFVWLGLGVGTHSAISNNGFCSFNPEGNLVLRAVLTAFLFFVGAPVCSCVTITFSILSYCYVKRNTLEENSATKKAMLRILGFHSIKIVILVIRSFIVTGYSGFSAASEVLSGRNRSIVFLAVYYTLSLLLVCVLLFVTPITSLLTLKPLSKALRQLCKIVCCCKRDQSTVLSRAVGGASAYVSRPLPQIGQVIELRQVGQES